MICRSVFHTVSRIHAVSASSKLLKIQLTSPSGIPTNPLATSAFSTPAAALGRRALQLLDLGFLHHRQPRLGAQNAPHVVQQRRHPVESSERWWAAKQRFPAARV